jgi:hypothetical protein
MVKAILLRARDLALSINAPAVLPERTYTPPDLFSDAAWQSAMHFRESRDSFESATRFHVVIVPRDHAPRSYYLCGSFAEVAARAKLFFPNPLSILCTPAVAGDSEYIDRRVHVVPIRTRSLIL